MMNMVFSKSLPRKTNEELLCELKLQVENERKLLMEILYSLREVEMRKLHLEMGYPDLYAFAMKELGYSAGGAYRRISAMRLLQSVPEAAPKLASGELGLENASQAHSFFRKENQRRKDQGAAKLSLEEKCEVVTELLGKSTREGLRLLTERSPDVMTPAEKLRPLPEQKTFVQFVANAELMGKLDELKSILAHQNFDGRMDVLIEKLADIALKKLKPSAKNSKVTEANVKRTAFGVIQGSSNTTSAQTSAMSPPPTPAAPPAQGMVTSAGADRISEKETKIEKQTVSARPTHRSRYIPARERRSVLLRDTNGCTYRDPKTGRICQNRHGLQFDHFVPYSLGGENTAQNLTLRCGAHNRFRAEQMKLSRRHL